MTKANCGSVLIIDQAGAMLGILTERDLMTRVLAKALDAKATPVAKVMTHQPHCVPPELKVSDAVLIMIERGFRHLPVVAPGGKILGCSRCATPCRARWTWPSAWPSFMTR